MKTETDFLDEVKEMIFVNDNEDNGKPLFSLSTPFDDIRKMVVSLPGRPPAILDQNLAEIYNTSTKRLNEQLRRNNGWLDGDYYFDLTKEEFAVANCDRKIEVDPKSRYMPKMFTDYGCNAAAFLVRTTEALKMRKVIIKAFTELRRKGGFHIKVDDFGQLVRDAYMWRNRFKTMTPYRLKKLMRYMDAGLNNAEIARLFNVSINTVRTWRKSVGQLSLYGNLEGPQLITLE